MNLHAHPASFRDPSGTVYIKNKRLYRAVYTNYTLQYRTLIDSGLYEHLTHNHLLTTHYEHHSKTKDVYTILEPETIEYISYPYEWTLSEYIDAALATLRIQKTALSFGMTLKDASAYNIQFHHGKPILIDKLSFDIYEEGVPWVAYRQFCMHFLAPILLMAKKHERLNLLMRSYIDGIPLPLTSSLLPISTYLHLFTTIHIHFHAYLEKRTKGHDAPSTPKSLTKDRHILLLDSLERTIRTAYRKPPNSHWSSYYNTHAYTSRAFEQKLSYIESYIRKLKPKTVLDIGSNTGTFSDICTKYANFVVAVDNDHASTDQHYQRCKKMDIKNCLPLVIDITSPSPSIGWENEERSSFLDRGPFDMVLALALMHHLTISHNIPFERIARLMCKLGRNVIIEFVPKNDSQVVRLLKNRNDIFTSYDQKHFEKAMSMYFTLKQKVPLKDSGRLLYMLSSKQTI